MKTPSPTLLTRIIIASQFAPPFMFSAVGVTLPAIGNELSAGAVSLGLVENLFLVAQLSFLLPVGRLADDCDKRSMYKWGLLGFALSSLLISVCTSITLVLMLRFIQGVCSATLTGSGPALLVEFTPPERRADLFSKMVASIYAGLMLGPICAGYLMHLYGWRGVFFVGGCVVLLAFMLIHWKLPCSWYGNIRAIDKRSTMLLLGGTISLLFATAMLGFGAEAYLCLIAAAFFIWQFVEIQPTLSKPILDLALLRSNHTLRRALGSQLLLYTNAFCSTFLITIYLQICLHQTPKTSGEVISLGTLVMALAPLFVGRLTRRFAPAHIASIGIALVLIPTMVALMLNSQSSLWLVAAIISSQGLGFALFAPTNMTTIMNSVASNSGGSISALAALTRSLGMVSGMFICTALLSLYLGNQLIESNPAAFLEVLSGTFLILTLVTTLALIISLPAKNSTKAT